MKIIMSHNLFERAKPILNEIQQYGFEAYFVGGSVRDYLMNRAIHDIDITTSATPDEIESIFDKTIPVGKQHGTINVVFNHENYEITSFRAEDDYIDHRRPSEVYFVRDLYQDVQRRDFTINAIAMDINYKTYDYFDGEKDIRNKCIRTVGNEQARFEEDALRIIRGLRFQSQLDFQIHNETFKAMKAQISDIQYLSIERIVVELKKLMVGCNVAESFNNMKELGAFHFIPFFSAFEMSQIQIIEPIDFELWIAILLVQQCIDSSLNSLKISNQEKSMIQTYMKLIELLPRIHSKSTLITLVYDFNIMDIEKVLATSKTLELNGIEIAHPLIINEHSIKEVAKHLPIQQRKELAVNGGDILKHMNTQSGPWLKDVLRQIEIAIITKEIKNTQDEILKWVDANVKI